MFVVWITDGDRSLASCVTDVLAGEQRKAAWQHTDGADYGSLWEGTPRL